MRVLGSPNDHFPSPPVPTITEDEGFRQPWLPLSLVVGPRVSRRAASCGLTDDGDMKIGDKVSWDTSQGRTQGKIVEKKTKDFQLAKQKFTASDDEPKFVVESDKTGARAAHDPSALHALKG